MLVQGEREMARAYVTGTRETAVAVLRGVPAATIARS